MLQVLAALLGISLLVVVHEAGHYFVARACGILVTRFSIGFGPVLASYRPKGSGTVFQVCAIPCGGSVTIAGMNPADPIAPNDPTLFPNKKLWVRLLTVLGGPAANYAFASLLVFGLALIGFRDARPSRPLVVASVSPGSPAAVAGVRAGDVILEANGRKVRDLAELSEVTGPRVGQATSYVIQRDGALLPPLEIVPKRAGARGVIGVKPKLETFYRRLSLGGALQQAVALPWVLTVQNVTGIVDLISRRTTEGLMGPVGMGKLMVEQADKGIYDFVGILIMLSVALGYFNLLPLPFLDGGRLIFLGYELVSRRRPDRRFEAVVHGIGMLALFGLLAFITLREVIG